MSTEPNHSSQASANAGAIKALDGGSIHKITSGQVVVDLQTAVKELVENSLDAGATTIEVRFKDYGLESFEVIDNGSGIPPDDYPSVALKHHTSKLSSFGDLESIATFGFRGEALSSLCALAESVTVTTATSKEAPAGSVLEFERTGKLKDKRGKAARQRGTTVAVLGLFKPLPVRRKDLERNAKREFGKALTLLHAHALVPCAHENRGVRLSVSNQPKGGKKSVQLRTDGTPSTRASVSALWGPKTLDNLVDLDLMFTVKVETAVLRRLGRAPGDESSNEVRVKGLISKFVVGAGRNGTDRQFLFVNGRPCASSKVQKAFNEVYRSFNATQSPFVIADFILPKDACDINVSPDKRTILLHSEGNLVQALKDALEETYAPSRAMFDVNASQAPRKSDLGTSSQGPQGGRAGKDPLFLQDDADEEPEEPLGTSSSQADVTRSEGERHKQYSVEDADALPPFGEPTLLSEPASETSSGFDTRAPSAHPSSQDDGEPEADGEEEGDNAPRVKVTVKPRPQRQLSPSAKETEARPSSKTSRGLDGIVRITPANISSSPSSSHCTFASRGRATSPAEDVEPIPAVRPPVRPNARTTSTVAGARATAAGSSKSADQMVLSTSGASWNLRRQSEAGEPARKRARVEGGAKEARVDMREMLRGFARSGAKVEDVSMEDDPDDVADVSVEEDGEDDDIEPDVSADETPEHMDEVEAEQEPPETEPSEGDVGFVEPMDEDLASEVIDVDVDEGMPSSSAADVDVVHGASGTTVNMEYVRGVEGESVPLSVDIARIVSTWKTFHTRLVNAEKPSSPTEQHNTDGSKVALESSAGIANAGDDESAAEALSRVIDKADFAHMQILGQFNLGFIVVRRQARAVSGDDDSTSMDDLFIVDQHAADEKYNFETLQHTTRIDSQKLLHPQVLELTAADELVALENLDVLRQNGFEVEVDEEAPAGRRVRLVAQPISKSTVFDTKDLEELLHLMHDSPAGKMVRCSKARAMFAMRACRKSVMIGTALSSRQMLAIVRHMGTMDQPWHCPHGRPTMRHLSDISDVGWDLRHPAGQGINWSAFGTTPV